MPKWCDIIILLRDWAPGLGHESLGGSQSDLSKPTTNALLHSGVWILYQYQSENLLPVEAKKEHFAPYEQEILLLRLCVFTPSEAL